MNFTCATLRSVSAYIQLQFQVIQHNTHKRQINAGGLKSRAGVLQLNKYTRGAKQEMMSGQGHPPRTRHCKGMADSRAHSRCAIWP